MNPPTTNRDWLCSLACNTALVVMVWVLFALSEGVPHWLAIVCVGVMTFAWCGQWITYFQWRRLKRKAG
jgi:hypothetical protein